MAKKKVKEQISDTNIRIQRTTVADLNTIKKIDGKKSIDRVIQELVKHKYPNGITS